MTHELVRAVDLAGINRMEGGVEAVCLPGPNLVLHESQLLTREQVSEVGLEGDRQNRE